jgi:Holliday junction resolvase
MSGKKSRRKGKRVEYAILNHLKKAGIKARRIPLSGATWLKGDVIIELDDEQLTAEIKSRKSAFKFLYENLKSADVLFVKADRKEPLAVLSISLFIKLCRRCEDVHSV